MRSSTTLRLLGPLMLAVTLAATLLAGCGPEFDPFHLANKFRVLTIKADPPEVILDPALFTGMGTPPPAVELSVLHSPAPPGTTWVWEVCLFSLDALAAFRCASDSLEVTLAADGPTARLDLLAVFLEIAANMQPGEMPDDMPDDMPGMTGDTGCPGFFALPDGTCLDDFRVQIRLTAGPPGEEIVSVRTVRVILDPTQPANQNPDVTALEVIGTPTRGGEVTLRATVDDASLETYVDVDGDTVTERPIFSWFTTAGELQPGATFDEIRETTLTLPTDPAIETVEVSVVVRDGDSRRGIDYETATITLVD